MPACGGRRLKLLPGLGDLTHLAVLDELVDVVQNLVGVRHAAVHPPQGDVCRERVRVSGDAVHRQPLREVREQLLRTEAADHGEQSLGLAVLLVELPEVFQRRRQAATRQEGKELVPLSVVEVGVERDVVFKAGEQLHDAAVLPAGQGKGDLLGAIRHHLGTATDAIGEHSLRVCEDGLLGVRHVRRSVGARGDLVADAARLCERHELHVARDAATVRRERTEDVLDVLDAGEEVVSLDAAGADAVVEEQLVQPDDAVLVDLVGDRVDVVEERV